jgi:drug/metabolite transporter (DMT)-like permease
MTDPPTHGRLDMAATAAALGSLCCWSIGPLFIEYLTAYLDAWTQNAIRYSVGCLFWMPFLVYVKVRGNLDRRVWTHALIPALAHVAMQCLWARSFYYDIGPGFLTLLLKTNILWVAGFSLIVFEDERPLVRSVRFWLGLGLSVAGVVGVLYFEDGFTSRATLTGVVLGLVTALAWAAYAVAVRVGFREIDSRVGFAVISLYTAVGLSVLALLLGEPADLLRIGPRPWAGIVFSAITGISLGHTFFYAAVRRIGATIPTLVTLAQPFVVFSFSSLVFHERMRLMQMLFGCVLLVGAAFSVWAQQHLGTPRPQRGTARDER